VDQPNNEATKPLFISLYTQIGAAYRNDINPGPNQYASAQIDLHGGGAVAVRMSPTNGNCYYLFLTYGRLDLILFKYFEGNLTQLSSIYMPTFIQTHEVGDDISLITLEANGRYINSYFSESYTFVNQIIDEDIVSGQPGMVCDADNNNIWYTDKGVITFEAGDLDDYVVPKGLGAIYISDSNNNRVIDRTIPNLEYISEFTDSGQLVYPTGICNDGTHLYLINEGKILLKYLLGETAADLTFVEGTGWDVFANFWGDSVFLTDADDFISYSTADEVFAETTSVVICTCDGRATIDSVTDDLGNTYTEVFSGTVPWSEAGTDTYLITDDFSNGTIDDPPWGYIEGTVSESGGTLNVTAASGTSSAIGNDLFMRSNDFYVEFGVNIQSITAGDSDLIYLASLYNSEVSASVFNVFIASTTRKIYINWRNNDNSYESLEGPVLSLTTPYTIGAYFKFGSGDGTAELYVDDILTLSIYDLANDVYAVQGYFPAIGSTWMDGTTGSASLKFDNVVFTSDSLWYNNIKNIYFKNYQ